MPSLDRRTLLGLLPAASLFAGSTPARAAEALRIATLKFGTVNWELETIRANGIDAAQGIGIDVFGTASSSAAKIAFEGGAADALVADWLWVARQRGEGRDFVFAPYSRSVGALIVPGDSPFERIEDMAGRKIGVAGGPLDKNWLILQAYARARGFDLTASAEPVFGAPPLIMQQALDGRIDGVLTYWHFEAKMRAQGFRTLVGMDYASEVLGLPKEIPLLGYIFRGEFARENPALVNGFLAASRAAKALLASDDAAWDALRPLMKPTSEAEFEALKAGFRAGIPSGEPIDPEGAAKMFSLMAELGGEKLVGPTTELPDGIFYDADS